MGSIMSDALIALGDYADPVTGLPSYDERSIDHVITDPPYCEHVHGRRNVTEHRNGYEVPAIEFPAFTLDDINRFAAEAARVARRWVIVFCSDRQLGAWIDALTRADLRYVRSGVWIKSDPMPQMSGDRPAQGFELMAVAHVKGTGRLRWNGGGRPLTYTGSRGEESGILRKRPHPTAKPTWLMESLIRDFTDPGDLIADPFAGSGSTGVAARRLGRRFAGWERDPRFHALAEARIGRTREQMEFPMGPRPAPPRQLKLVDEGGG